MTIARTVNEWFGHNRRDLPWRREGFGAWGILVSEVMLQQTPVARVIPRLEAWLQRWPSPASLAASAPGDALREWQRLGYPRRALNLHAAAVAITSRHAGVVPADLGALLALPGVGDYTARAVAAFAYGQRHPVVDTNVRRVLARAVGGLASTAPPTQRDLAAMDAILPLDDADAQLTNAAMMELGALVCTARAPRCDACPLAAQCRWRLDGYPALTAARPPAQKKYEGSDRQVRGLILALMRESGIPISASAIEAVWPDAAQRSRALDSLIVDGLAEVREGGFGLPG